MMMFQERGERWQGSLKRRGCADEGSRLLHRRVLYSSWQRSGLWSELLIHIAERKLKFGRVLL